MGLMASVREAMRGIGALMELRRAGRRAGRPEAAAGPGAPPRPAVRRPDEDPALAARLSRWRSPGAAAPGSGPMTTDERDAAMRQLEELAGRLQGRPADVVAGALAGGRVSVRALGPQDGHVWEMPGLRVFAIVGVQAFTVEDEPGA